MAVRDKEGTVPLPSALLTAAKEAMGDARFVSTVESLFAAAGEAVARLAVSVDDPDAVEWSVGQIASFTDLITRVSHTGRPNWVTALTDCLT